MRRLDVTDSTNARALAWAAEGAPEGAVVVAGHQTAGRGRHGRRWEAPPGTGLLMSVVLRPRFAADRLGSLTIAAGVAVARAVEGMLDRRAELKWPNDVLVSGRKIAGILTEGAMTGSDVRAAVVGIGVNVRWDRKDMPDDLADRATSLAIEAGDGPLPEDDAVLKRVLTELERAYDAIHHDPRSVLDEARDRSAILGEEVVVTWPDGRRAAGRALEIAPDGALRVETAGTVRDLHAADVERVRPRDRT